MSLRVWLPLNGTLENKGLDNVTVTNNGATVDNNGKVGKCYSFDGSDDFISLNGSCLYDIIKGGSQPFSISFWVYQADSTRAIIFGDYSLTGGIGFNIELTAGHVVRFYWNGSPDLSISQLNVGATIWNHVVLVYDTTHLYGYLNGNLVYTYTGTLTTKNKTSGDYYLGRDYRTGNTALNGKINDVRIYDHALSPLEVKQISQGLILHYPLNRNGWGQENLLKGTQLLDKDVIIPNGVVKTVDAYQGLTSATYNNSSGTSYHELLLWSNKVTVNANEIYTASFYAKSPTSTTLTCYFYNNTSNIVQVSSGKSSTGSISTTTDGMIALQLTPNWTKYWITWTFNNNSNSALKTLLFRCSAGTSELSICGVKLEKGLISTPWCPNSADELYNTLGLNDNVEYDTSGYGNNGTKINTLTYSSDTPKYNVSTHFGATNQKIHINNLTTTGFSNSYSFAWWGKRTSNSPMFWGFSNGVRLNGMYFGNLWNTGDGSSNPIYKPGTTTQITVPSLNIWHHYVMTGDGTTCKLYLDGELYGQAKTYKSITGTSIFINGYDNGTSYCHDNMDMSDFRIYATALSADDIKSLYNNSAYIDNQGNLYGAILREV